MSDLADYVTEVGQFSFEEKEFNDIDALVLSEFCYLKFDGLVDGPNGKEISLSEMDKLSNRESLFSEPSYEKDNRLLYNAIVGSKRFSELRMFDYINEVCKEEETQFSAITFVLPNNIMVVTFRGTDETMLGWKEDFEMALKKPVTGHLLSAMYLNHIYKYYYKPGIRLMVAGHSKGGNLAMYSAMYADSSVREAVEKIYSFDGPGFRPEIIPAEAGDAVRKKTVRIIPKSSPIGLWFNTADEATVIEAKSVGALQHNPYNWIIKDGNFVVTGITEQHRISMQAMNEWLLALDDDNLQLFVDMLCWVLDATDAATTTEMKQDFAAYAKNLIKAGSMVDKDMKDKAGAFIKSYIQLTGSAYVKDITAKYEAFVTELNHKREELLEITGNVKRDVIEKTEAIKKKSKKTI